MISVPKRLRGFLADRPSAVAALTKIFLDEIERLLCAAAGGTSDPATPASACPRLGGISLAIASARPSTAMCICGTRVTDGVFVPAADDAERDAPPAFLPARPINQADLAALGVWLVFSRENVPDPFRPKGGQKGQAPFADTNGASPSHDASRIAWAKLMARVGEEFPLTLFRDVSGERGFCVA